MKFTNIRKIADAIGRCATRTRSCSVATEGPRKIAPAAAGIDVNSVSASAVLSSK